MDGVIFALATPLLIKEFGVTLTQWRSGLQIALLIGIAGIFFWPWLADRVGRRSLLAINIALFSLMMPIVALTTTFTAFNMALRHCHFATTVEWAFARWHRAGLPVGALTPVRSFSISGSGFADRFGAALAGAIATWVFSKGYGWWRWPSSFPPWWH